MRRSIAVVFAAAVVAAVAGSCADESAGPGASRVARLSIVPDFGALRTDVVDFALARFLVTRVPGGEVARDTVIELAAGQDSVGLDLTVQILTPGETFTLTVTLISTTGDTAFRGGPVQVTPSADGPPVAVDLDFEYVGVGAAAAAVEIATPDTATFTDEIVVLTAAALDSSQAPIANTPIGWESLDSAVVRITGRDAQYQGTAVGGPQRGTARVVATLPTGQQDTVLVSNQPQPSAIVAESGNNQSALADSVLAQPLVVRVTGGDGLGIDGVWVRFGVTSGGGAVSADSARTDPNGRALVTYTMARSFQPHVVRATTARLPSAAATFNANLLFLPPAVLEIVAGDGQTATAGSAVAVAPQVRVRDADGLVIPGVTVTFTVTSGGGTVTGGSPVTDTLGLAAVTGWTLGTGAGANALGAMVDALQVAFGATGVAGAATQIALVSGSGQSDTVGATLAQPLVVRALDPNGNPAEGATVDWAGAGLSAATTQTDAAGLAQVTWTLGTVTGPHAATATLNGTSSTVPFSATATPGVATRLGFTVQPADAVEDFPITPAVEVTAFDRLGNVAVGFTGTIQLDLLDNPGDASLGGPTSADASAGVAPFPGLTVSAPASGYTLLATAPGLESDTSAAFDVVSAGQVQWISGAGGDWSNGANWNTGAPPGPTDTAAITLPGTYTVTLDQDATVGMLVVGGASGVQTLSQAAHTLNVTGTAGFGVTGAFAWSGGTILGGAWLNLGVVTWTGGTIGGTVALTNNGTLVLSGAAAKTVGGTARLTNSGTLQHAGTGSLVLTVGAVVTNGPSGVFDLQGAASIDWVTGTTPEPLVVNEGTIRKSAGAGLSFIDQLSNLGGTIEVLTGELELRHFAGTTNTSTGGVFTVASGATLDLTPELASYDDARFHGAYTGSGGGTVSFDGGTLNVGAGASFDFPAPMVQWAGGAITGGPFTNLDAVTWTGGSVAGDATFLNSGLVALAGAGAKTLAAGAFLTNAGTMIHAGTGSLVLNVGSVLDNQAAALYEFRDDAAIDWVSGTSPEPFVNNAGTISKTAGTGLSFIDQLQNQGGTLSVQTGELELRSFDGTTNVSTGGTFIVSPGATLDLTAEQAAHDDGAYQGTYTGSGGGTVLLDNGVLRLGTGATFDLPGPMLQWRAGTLFGGALTNSGVLAAAGAGVKTVAASATLVNQGTLAVESGTITVQGTFTHAAGATLGGNGTLDLTSAVAPLMDGSVAPGLSPGLLTIVSGGGLSLGATASVDIELAGAATPGTDFDLLRITGPSAALGGTLNAVLVPPYAPAGGERWPVVTGILGSFDAINLPATLDTLTSNDTLFIVSTAPPGLRVAGWGVERSPVFSLSAGTGMQEARASLLAVVPDATVVGHEVLTPAALANVDVLVLPAIMNNAAGIPPLSTAEQSALTGFVLGGGCAVILAENSSVAAANASLLDPFGMAASGLLSGQVTATVTDPTSTPITQGPFGAVNTFSQNFAGFLSSLGPAASLATNELGPALAVVPSNALGAGSGPVIVYSDPNTFADADAAGFFAANETLWRNTISACLSGVAPPGGGTNLWTNPAGGQWSDPANWSLGRVPEPTDTAFITLDGTYTVIVDEAQAVDLLVVGGAAAGVQTLRLQQAPLDVTVGMLVNPGGRLFLANGSLFGTLSVAGALRVEGASSVNGALALLPAATAFIQGNNNFTHATLSVGAGFSNAGLIELDNGSAGSTWSAGIIVSGGPLVNQGVISTMVSAGGGSRTVSGDIQNLGTLAAAGYPLVIAGTFSHLPGGVLQGTAPIDFTTATIGAFEGEIRPGTSPGLLGLLSNGFQLGAGATVQIELAGTAAPGTDFDQLDAAAPVTLDGTLAVSLINPYVPVGGERWPILAGVIGSFATLSLPTVSGVAFDTLTVDGGVDADTLILTATAVGGANPVNWTGAVDANWSTPGNWDTGVVPAPGDSVVINLSTDYLVNVNTSASVGWLIVGDAGNPVIDIPGGTQLIVTSGATFGTNSEVVLRGGALLNGPGPVAVLGHLNWQGGTIQGPGSTLIAGTAATGGNVLLDGRALSISGSLTVDGAPGTLAPLNAPTIEVLAGGMLELVNGPDLFLNGTTPSIVNAGTIRVAGTDDEARVDWPITNTGQIDVVSFVFDVRGALLHQAGLVSIAAGAELASRGHSDVAGDVLVDPGGVLSFTGGALDATHLLGPASSVQSSGTVNVDGATLVQVLGAFQTDSLRFLNATLRFDGADTAFATRFDYAGGGVLGGAGIFAIRGPSRTVGGNLNGTGTLAVLPGGNLSLQSPVRGWTVDVAGALVWGDWDLSLDADPVSGQNARLNILPGGRLEVQHNATSRSWFGTNLNPITNAGTIAKSLGTVTSSFRPPITNTGVIDVQVGTLETRGLVHQSGATVFGNGTLQLVHQFPTELHGGFSPGASPGMLTITGSDAAPYAPQAAGVLDIEVNGPTVGTGYDRLVVSGGAAALSGTLNVALGTFTPTTADTMTILTATAVSGTFTTANVPAALALAYLADRVILVGTAPAPGGPPVIYAGDWAGDLSGIFRVDGDGSNGARITPEGPPGQPFVRPRWSPDGTRATYSARAGGLDANQLHVISAQGVPPDHLTSIGDTSTWNPRYSPNGQHLAFECGHGDYPNSAQDVCVVANVTGPLGTLNGIADGDGKEYVTDAISPDLGGSGAFAWDPNNPDRLAVVRDSSLGGPLGSQIWFVNFDGTSPTPLGTRVVLDQTGFPVTIAWMDWSPDGSFIAFEGDSPSTGRSVYRIDPGTGEVTQLTTGAADFRPVVSPDNSEILFARAVDGVELMRIPAAGGTVVTISPAFGFPIELGGWDWSPDGTEIVHTTMMLSGGAVMADLMIGKVPAATTIGDYAGMLQNPARVGPGDGSLVDRLPTWRP